MTPGSRGSWRAAWELAPFNKLTKIALPDLTPPNIKIKGRRNKKMTFLPPNLNRFNAWFEVWRILPPSMRLNHFAGTGIRLLLLINFEIDIELVQQQDYYSAESILQLLANINRPPGK
jgi:hypothetical protein